MPSWRESRNAAARAQLEKALPTNFPPAVLTHALARSWVPHLPRLAVESYWQTHPVRADRLARSLAIRSGAPEGWRWCPTGAGRASFRDPPAPFREPEFRLGPGRCCVCGQPVFRLGWHQDLWAAGPNVRTRWHAACVAAWKLWTGPNAQVRMLARLQNRRCAATGKRLLRDAEADHRVPLFRVWREERDRPWPDLLGFWGFPNLQALNVPAHRSKSAREASDRAVRRPAAAPPQSASA